MSETNGHLKLNIGSGDQLTMKGYVNVDAKFGQMAYPLQYPDDCADEIYASHILEHFSWRETAAILKEWVRVLKPGCWLKIAVPNFEWIAQAYLREKSLWRGSAPIQGYVAGGQVDDHDFHSAIFDKDTLSNFLKDAGLTEISAWESEVNDCARLPVSLNLMGQKPQIVQPAQIAPVQANGAGRHFVAGEWRDTSKLTADRVKIVPGQCAVVVSSPRYGSLIACDVMWSVIMTLRATNHRAGGAWWEQGLCNQIEDVLEQKDSEGNPVEFIITMDFDTYTHPDDIVEMLKLLFQNPQYDAIIPCQVRRGAYEEVLAKVAGQVDLNDALIPVMTGHFGLTIFRRRVFERLPKPWMLNVPNEQGRWRDGNTDADIYFWNRFNDAGFKAGMTTRVMVGHGDECVCWPTVVNGKVVKVYQTVYQWLATRRKPEGVSLIEAQGAV